MQYNIYFAEIGKPDNLPGFLLLLYFYSYIKNVTVMEVLPMLTKNEKLKALESSGGETVKAIADVIGSESTLELVENFGGAYVYIPSPETIFMETRNKHIMRDYGNGVKPKLLAEKYKLTYAGVMKIIRAYKKEDQQTWKKH